MKTTANIDLLVANIIGARHQVSQETVKTKTKLSAKAVIDATGLDKNFSAKIADIYNILKPAPDWHVKHEATVEEITGEKIPGTRFKINHNQGFFSFFVPEKIADHFRALFSIECSAPIQEHAGEIINLATDISNFIKRAAKFKSTDDLRTSLLGILIEIEDGNLSIVATDAHTLYKSKPVKCDAAKNHALLLNGNFANLGEVTAIEVCENGVKMAGKLFEYIDAKFPNYTNVMPNYAGEMKFDPKALIGTLKSLKSMQNNTTHKVAIHFNGCIQVSAEDIDWGNEAKIKIPYISKSFVDCEIGFNAKLLQRSLAVFKDKELILKTDGEANRGVLLTGSNEVVLIMPVSLKQ